MPATLTNIRHESEYDQLVLSLSDERFVTIQDHPLVFWTRPADRRMPLIFMSWPLRRLLKLGFDEIYTMPGVGAKKVVGLLELLRRIAEHSDTQSDGQLPAVQDMTSNSAPNGHPPFDARSVSESEWQQWCETLHRHELMGLPIGRVARSLEELPMVIWSTALGKYLGLTLAEIRELKTHGPKRVRIVLEAYWTVHCALHDTLPHEHIHLELVPRFARRVETWIEGQLASESVPALDELRAELAQPLVDQLAIDVGQRIANLVSNRLGINGATVSVRNQAAKVGVTRARVYQWLEECANVMHVRWPAGRWKMRALRGNLDRQPDASEQRELLNTMTDMFFPDL